MTNKGNKADKEYLHIYYKKTKHIQIPKITINNRRRRHAQKLQAIKLFGGKCQKCGYNKCVTALEFHHKTNGKEKSLSRLWQLSWKKITEELKKCILLCANCHRELHETEA